MKKAPKGGPRRRRDGPTSDQIDEVTAMFGEDYGDMDDEEEEEDEGDESRAALHCIVLCCIALYYIVLWCGLM